jgi:DNA polymerase-3 subunit epsilon
LPDHGLGPLCEALGLVPAVCEVVPEKSWHDALFDAAASLILLRHLIDALALRDHPVAVLLQADTSAWHRMRNSAI